MPTVMSKTKYTFVRMRIDRLKATHVKRAKKIATLEKQLNGVKPVDMRHERRKRAKARKSSKRRNR